MGRAFFPPHFGTSRRPPLPRQVAASPVAVGRLGLASYGVRSTPCRNSTPVRPPVPECSPLWQSPVTATPPAGASDGAPQTPCRCTGCRFAHTVCTGRPAVDSAWYGETGGPWRSSPDSKHTGDLRGGSAAQSTSALFHAHQIQDRKRHSVILPAFKYALGLLYSTPYCTPSEDEPCTWATAHTSGRFCRTTHAHHSLVESVLNPHCKGRNAGL